MLGLHAAELGEALARLVALLVGRVSLADGRQWRDGGGRGLAEGRELGGALGVGRLLANRLVGARRVDARVAGRLQVSEGRGRALQVGATANWLGGRSFRQLCGGQRGAANWA